MSLLRRMLLLITPVLLVTPADAQHVPPESALPDATPIQIDVPGEAQLPREVKSAGQTADETPGEEVLPGRAAKAPPNNQAALPGHVRPWLRLAMEGHTGNIRSIELSADGANLFTGGEDKDLHCWRRSNFAKTNWLHRRVVRWQVNRGPRGRIYAIAANGKQVAMAGHGATGRLGEIWVVDRDSGELIRPLIDEQDGHRQVIQSLAWSPATDSGRRRLASHDVEGHIIVWEADSRTGLWSGRTVVKPDHQTYGERVALQIRPSRGFVPVVFDTPETIISAHFVGFNNATPPQSRWHLKRTNINSGGSVVLDTVDHLGGVVALDASDRGDKLVSSDSVGNVTLWRFGAAGSVQQTWSVKPGGRPLFVDLDREGNRLLLGTELAVVIEDQSRARVQLWDTLGAPRFLSEVYPRTHAVSGVLNETHDEALIAVANRIEAYSLTEAGKFKAGKRVLSAPIRPVYRVAFVTGGQSPYKVAIGSQPNSQGTITLDRLFDLSRVSLAGNGPARRRRYSAAAKTRTKVENGRKADRSTASVSALRR